MSDAILKRMLRVYEQNPIPTSYFTGHFQTPPENIYSGEKVEIDIERSGREVAIAVADLSVSGNENKWTQYTSKEFVPPVLKERINVNAWQTIKRTAGQITHSDPDFRMNAFENLRKQGRHIEGKIARSIELQCSQVLQTGTVTLIDANGAEVFGIDYSPKTSHFPNASLTWANAAAVPITNLENLADQINQDGLSMPNKLTFGSDAWNAFISNTQVKDYLDNRRIVLGGIAPRAETGGARWMGYLDIAGYTFELWVYKGYYEHPQTGAITQFMDPNKVIMSTDGARLDLTYGRIPRIITEGSRQITGLFPSRVNIQGRIPLDVHVWSAEDDSAIKAEMGTRPLAIPTAIDTYGCLTAIL